MYMDLWMDDGRSFSLDFGSGWRKVSSTTTFWARVLEFVRTVTSAAGRLTKQLLRVGRRDISAGELAGFGDMLRG